MAKIKIPTAEEIAEKKEALKAKIEVSKESAKNGRISPTQTFLKEVEDIIKDAINNQVSFTQIAKDIYAVFNFKVSTQTIRVFAQNHLGFEKKQRVAKPKNDTPKNESNEQKKSDRVKSDFGDI